MADPVILIVDDNENNRFTLSMRLEDSTVAGEKRPDALRLTDDCTTIYSVECFVTLHLSSDRDR